MWNLPGPGIEPMFPALAGRFLSTILAGKSSLDYIDQLNRAVQTRNFSQKARMREILKTQHFSFCPHKFSTLENYCNHAKCCDNNGKYKQSERHAGIFKENNTGVGSLSLLQWAFPTQELNRGLLHCRQILYHLSCQYRRY